MDEAVQRVYARIRERVWDRDEADDNDTALDSLSAIERAIYVTRELEEELDDGGWYLVFANEDDHLIEPALAGYELLGLQAYVAHLREVRRVGYGDDSTEDEGERLDAEYATLTGAEAARARALRVAGTG